MNREVDSTTRQIVAVIVTHNGENCVALALDSIKSEQCLTRTVVVDNASTDATLAAVKTFPGVLLVESGRNLGFGAAHELAFRAASDCRAEFFFLLNQDAFVTPGALAHLLRVAGEAPEYGILTPLQSEAPGGVLDSNFASFGWGDSQRRLLSDALRSTVHSIYEISFAPAAAWLVRREVIDEIGGFSPAFFHYGEDKQFCQRVLFAGWKMGVCPGAEVVHARSPRGTRATASRIYGQRVAANLVLELMDVGRSFLRSALALPVRSARRAVDLLFARRFRAVLTEMRACLVVSSRLPRYFRIWRRERQLALSARRRRLARDLER